MVNPIGSQDPADFKVNVGNLDKAMNDQASQSWTDRFGVDRLTWFGIETKSNEAINGLAFQIPVDYAAGLNVNANGFTVTYNGVVYAPQPSAVPFTTAAWDAAQWYPIQNIFNQNNLLVFEDYAAASAAAATLPDGQIVESPNVDGNLRKYVVSGNALADLGAAETYLSGETLTALPSWNEIPQVRGKGTTANVNAQAQALANRTEFIAQELTQPSGNAMVGGLATFAQLASYAGPATRIEILDAQRGGVFVRRGSKAEDRWITCGKDAHGRSWEREAYRGGLSIDLDWAPVVYDNTTDNSEVIQYIFDTFNSISARPEPVFIASPVYVRRPITFRAQMAGETGASFSFTTSNNDGVIIEARSVVFENVVVKGRAGTALVDGKWTPVATSGRGWVIGGAGKNAQGAKLRNCWADANGGTGFELVQCNNGEFDVGTIYNGGDGWLSNPSPELNFSGNRINVFNSYGNIGNGVVVSGESNQVTAISQSNAGYNLELRSLFYSTVQGYTEYGGAGELYISANSSGNFITGTLRPLPGKKDIVRDAAAEENPERANWIITNSDDYETYESNFYSPRLRLESFYTLPKKPKLGELMYTSVDGYNLPLRSLRFLDRTVGWREFSFHDSVGSKTLSSTSAARPTDVSIGDSVFDTTLGKPIWVKTGERPTVYVTFAASLSAANLTITLPSGSHVIAVPAGLDTGKLVADYVWEKIMETPTLAASIKVHRQGLLSNNEMLVMSFNSCVVSNAENFYVSSSVAGLISTNVITSYGVAPVWVEASGLVV